MSRSLPTQNKRTGGSGPLLTAQDVWRVLSRASFAVLSHVTPAGAPRSSGVVYVVSQARMYVAVAKDSWKARHIGAQPTIAVTVPIRRGGVMSLLAPIPPATVSFAAVATVHPGEMLTALPQLARLLPPERYAACSILEIRPVGHFLTYGIGVPLLAMRDPTRARARVPVDAVNTTVGSR